MKTYVLSLLNNRSPYRAIAERPVEPEKVRALCEAAQLSASCFNNQPWRFLVLQAPEALEKAREALSEGNRWARSAPVLILGFSRRDLDCLPADGREYYLFDLGMATQNILLQATELGLVARPMAGFSPAKLREAFQIPKQYQLTVLVAVGYPGNLDSLDEEHRKMSTAPRKRNPLESNFFFDRFDAGALP
jgi:nitroreductase